MARLIMAIILSLFLAGFGDPVYFSNKEGNRLYDDGQFDEALERYKKAKTNNPGQEPVDYNIGNTYYRLKRYSEAERSYVKATSADSREIKRNVEYNRGVTLFKAGEGAWRQNKIAKAKQLITESVKQFKATLKNDPDDNDARHNLELALEWLKEIEQKKKEERNQQQKKKEEQKEDNTQQSKAESGERDKSEEGGGEEEKEQESAQRAKDHENEPAEKEKKEDSEAKPQNITPEQARQIFSAMERDERELRKKLRAENSREERGHGKDW